MRILVTGSRGFVGRWACRELADNGDEVVEPGERDVFDVLDSSSIDRVLARERPDAILHLAAVSHSQAARADPEHAFAVNVGGTIGLMEAVRRARRPPAVLVAGSGEVYGWPSAGQLPLTEGAPLRPKGAYAMSKAAQESVALAYRERYGLRAAVTRAFNHSGPGQGEPLVLPSLARRVAAVARGESSAVRVGNIDVARDFLDVRDVVDAYRRLLHHLVDHRVTQPVDVVNVASGHAIPLRELLDLLCRLAGVPTAYVVDPELVRPGEPREIRGDAQRLRELVGWRPRHDLDAMVADLWTSICAAAG